MDMRGKLLHIWSMTITVVGEARIPRTLAVGVSIKKHIKRFMKKHISNWTEKYAFSGEECVVDFFNDVISNSITLCE